MATIGTLTANLQLESAAFIRDLNKSAQAMQRSAQQIERDSAQMTKGLTGVSNAASTLKSGLVTLGIGFGVSAVSGL
jgi:hypothetical protein